MKSHIHINIDRCVGCFACVVTCIDQNYNIDEDGPSFRRILKYEDEKNQTITYYSLGCMHCEDSPCLSICPTTALYRDEKTGLILINKIKCIGCGKCLKACPFDVPKFDRDNKMIKCDGCVENIKSGVEPACVHTCPSKALELKNGINLSSHKLKERLKLLNFIG